MQVNVDLDSVFECKQHIETFLLAQIAQSNAAIEIPKLSGPNSVRRIHLGHYPIRCLPLLGGSTLHQRQTQAQYKMSVLLFNLTHLKTTI